MKHLKIKIMSIGGSNFFYGTKFGQNELAE